MAAYAVGILNDVVMGPPIVEYLERIDDTLRPHGGRFVVHGSPNEMQEGDDPGTLIVIEFPDLDRVRAWYTSTAYQAIVPLRAGNSRGAIFFVDGVDADHLATDVLRPPAA